MKYIPLTIFAAFVGTYATADVSLTNTITSTTVTASAGSSSLEVSGIAYGLSYTNITPSNFAYLAQVSYLTGSDITQTAIGGGVGYALTNNLNVSGGSGSRSTVGVLYSNSNSKIFGSSSSSNDLFLLSGVEFALAEDVIAGLTLTSPVNSLGDVTYSSKIGYNSSFGEISLRLGGGSSDTGGVSVNANSWGFGFTNRF
jgi:hypothetical protein